MGIALMLVCCARYLAAWLAALVWYHILLFNDDPSQEGYKGDIPASANICNICIDALSSLMRQEFSAADQMLEIALKCHISSIWSAVS